MGELRGRWLMSGEPPSPGERSKPWEAREASGDVARLWLGVSAGGRGRVPGGGGDGVEGGLGVDGQADQAGVAALGHEDGLSLIHISEPTRLRRISYAVFCLKKKK